MSVPVFSVLRASDPAQSAEWRQLWEDWTAREVFAHPGYVRLFAGGGEEAMCAVLRSDTGAILYPFVKRPIPVAVGRFDLTSAYGYGGAFITTPEAAGLAESFWSEFGAWARAEGVVAEFVRFALFPDALLAYPGEREERLQNVVRTLGVEESVMWYDFDHKVRKNVQKAQRSGVTIECDPGGARLEEFLRIYYSTMERRAAPSGYYFPRPFFESLVRELGDDAVFFHALLDGRVVSTELVLASARSAYSFLGGTDESAFAVRPNDLLKFEAIKWSKSRGLDHFVFGGGSAPDDGIFRYKRAFAPDGVVPFYVGRRILDSVVYDALVEERRARGGSADTGGFFPAYRAP